MKRTPFKSKAPERKPAKQIGCEYIGGPRAVARATVELPMARPVLKDEGFYSEPWRRAVAGLDCVLCGKHGNTQAAHRNEGKAGGRKLMDDCWTAALCAECHSEIDQGKTLDREDRRERIDLAILLTVRQLARDGKLRIA